MRRPGVREKRETHAESRATLSNKRGRGGSVDYRYNMRVGDGLASRPAGIASTCIILCA